MIMLAINLAIYMYCVPVVGYVGVSEAVGVSSGCLGLPLML